jgi:hypothetical protein
MNDSEFNPGILIGGTLVVLSVLAALAALYLWAVKRGLDPQSRYILPWLGPLVLTMLILNCLGIVAVLSKAYQQRSWPEAPKLMLMSFAAFMMFVFWSKLRKKSRSAQAIKKQ